jgi:plastocyanin
MLRIGGAIAAGPLLGGRSPAATVIDVEMRGNKEGSRVWFEPAGILVRPGDTVRWTNRDPGNAHTSTAYHPDNDGHPLRIPPGARAWDSDYLLPDQSFSVTLATPGVYDYFCTPHEHAGMVGRIVVAEDGAPAAEPATGDPVPGLGGDLLPSVEEIMERGRVSRAGGT